MRLHTYPATLVGTPATVVEDPAKHTHSYVPWRRSAGSEVIGYYCPGCNDLQVD